MKKRKEQKEGKNGKRGGRESRVRGRKEKRRRVMEK